MHIITRKVTLKDRLSAAYHAFHMRYTPDVERMMKTFEEQRAAEEAEIEALEIKRNQAVEQLQPYDIALVDSIYGITDNWRELFDPAMLAIEALPVDDQITIVKYMFAGNRYITTTLKFRQWMTVNVEALLNSIPE